jgi:hypothetical protein
MRKERQDRLEAEKAAKAYDKAIVYPETVKPDDRKAKGGSIKSSASKRADGIAARGKTKGRIDVMPSKSAKQHRFMQAVAHSPSFAKKAGVSQSVGKDFSAADKGKTLKKAT